MANFGTGIQRVDAFLSLIRTIGSGRSAATAAGIEFRLRYCENTGGFLCEYGNTNSCPCIGIGRCESSAVLA